MKTGLRCFAIAASLVLFGAGTAPGQAYPNKPLRVLTSEAGGGNDFSARVIAQNISAGLGQPVIVDNRGGASGYVSIMTVVKAPPDGYTMLFFANGLWTLPLLQSAPYDAVQDLLPISLTGKVPTVLVVHPSSSAISVKDVIAMAKAKPGGLNFASAAPGSAVHLAAELFKSMAGVNMVGVFYKGGAPALTSLVSNEVHLMFAVVTSGMPLVKAGRLRALAVTSAEPSALTPGLPTVAASGLPGFEVASTQGLWAPVRTPAAIVARLNQEIVRAISKPDVKEKFIAAGVDTIGTTPEQFAAYIKSDIAVVGKLITKAGIRAE